MCFNNEERKAEELCEEKVRLIFFDRICCPLQINSAQAIFPQTPDHESSGVHSSQAFQNPHLSHLLLLLLLPWLIEPTSSVIV